MTKAVELVMDLIVTVSGVVLVAVKVTPVAVAVATAVNIKLVALLTDVATVSFGGMPGPEITVPAESVTGEAVVTTVLPLAVVAGEGIGRGPVWTPGTLQTSIASSTLN